MTDPALTSTRNHQGRPWCGPGAGTPVELRVGPKTTAGHGRGSRRSLINGICYPATRTIRTGTRTVSEAWDRMIAIRRRLVGDRWAPGFRDSFRGVSGLGACFVSVVSSQICAMSLVRSPATATWQRIGLRICRDRLRRVRGCHEKSGHIMLGLGPADGHTASTKESSASCCGMSVFAALIRRRQRGCAATVCLARAPSCAGTMRHRRSFAAAARRSIGTLNRLRRARGRSLHTRFPARSTPSRRKSAVALETRKLRPENAALR
jgi:hypothetical protein